MIDKVKVRGHPHPKLAPILYAGVVFFMTMWLWRLGG